MFINLKCRTEYSFKRCFGPIKEVIKAVGDAPAIGIADNNSTWGHVAFHKACKKAGKKAILGVQLNVVSSLDKERFQDSWTVTVLARNLVGLAEIYKINSRSYEQMYYVPRTTISEINSLSDNVIILSGSNPHHAIKHKNMYYELNPGFHNWNRIVLQKNARVVKKDPVVLTSDVFFPTKDDRIAYELIDDNPDRRTTPQHILNTEEALALGYGSECVDATSKIADLCEQYDLPQAQMVQFKGNNLEAMCREGIITRKIEWSDEYEQRLNRELELIAIKQFEDYFYLVSDMCVWAKKHMLVGPARGSAAGSLVCYLLYITEIDPIPFGLMFERFIDITRSDLPDIDLDFPDDKRELVINYLEEKYGKECVAHIGTINRFKPKSAIGEAAKKYNIPAYETADVKNAIIERSGGDARAAFCIRDTFESLDIGKAFIAKYPSMINVARIEEHARHSGCHAAGILVCSHDVKDCCTVNNKDNVAQIDKYDAEALNLLKIDVLGLRTLNVLDNCMRYLGKNPLELYDLPLDDYDAFNIINERRYSGIFQFEGYALQSLAKQMGIHKFDDIVAITSLARPGPLHCGGATAFIERRTGKSEIEYDHIACKPATDDTYGVVVYQEQVMNIAREVGQLSWEDVCMLRKAMSKSLGEEFFNQYWIKFNEGAANNGLEEKEARKVWDNMCTFGSWAFNKSHAVSYGLLSYWCMYLKAHHPLEYALACLNNEKDSESTIKMLRELVKEGYKFKPFDAHHSDVSWSIHEGSLLGGLTSIKGIGTKKAEALIARRKMKLPLLAGQIKLLQEATTPWDNIFETENRFGDYYKNPSKYGITTKNPVRIEEIDGDGEWIFIGKIKDKNLRDLNEYGNVVKRGGKLVEKDNLFLNLTVEDDTDTIICTVDRFRYAKYGKPIVESGKIGDYYLIKGRTQQGWRKIYIERIRPL